MDRRTVQCCVDRAFGDAWTLGAKNVGLGVWTRVFACGQSLNGDCRKIVVRCFVHLAPVNWGQNACIGQTYTKCLNH